MNILYLSHRVPYPPNKGEKIHVFNTLKFLAQFYSIHLAAFNGDSKEKIYEKDLLKICKSVAIFTFNDRFRKILALMSLAKGKSATEGYFYSRKIKKFVNQIISNVDLVIAESSSMARHAMGAKCPVIVDLVDVDSDKWRQYADFTSGIKKWIYSIEARRVEKLENEIAITANHLLLVTPEEVDLFKKRTGIKHVSVLMNGVDTAYFHTSEDVRCPEIVFTGALDYYANVEGVLYFHEQIWPKILNVLPNIKWTLVGSNPVSEIVKLSKHPQITVTGTVPDVRPFLWKAGVSVTPLRIARGIQNKVLEAMACGVPVVCSPQAFEGLKAVPGEDLFVEACPESFAQRVITLIQSPELAFKMSHRAYEYVKQNHDWEKNLRVLKELCDELIQKREKRYT